MSRWSAILGPILAAVVTALPSRAEHLNTNFRKPVAELARYEFTQNVTPSVVSGVWAASGGTFNSTSTTTSIATVDFYIPEGFEYPEDTEVNARKFWHRARMLNERSGSTTRVGIIYLYQDASNFHEATFSPTGSVFVREVTNGVARTVATGTYSGGGQNRWFDAEVAWTADETVVLVNGLPVVRGLRQNARTRGRVGLITRQTTAKFDRVLVTREYGDPEFRESFTAGAPPWQVLKGNWNVVNGAYQNSAIEHTSLTLLPVVTGSGGPSDTIDFLVEARMLNPYGSSGNQVGFAYNYEDRGFGVATYDEIVFGGDGIARANWVQTDFNPGGSTIRTLQEAVPYSARRGEWFDVALSGNTEGSYVQVSVDGGPGLFQSLGASFGPIGLVTHFAPGRFDDVWFSHNSRISHTETFTSLDNRVWFPMTGTWDITGGVLNSRAAGASDLAYTQYQRSTDYTVNARMLNLYGGSGNRIGLVFGWDIETNEYYEVLFAPTGEAYFNKFIQGQLTRVATGTHTALGRNVWFEVELARRGPFATVKVNGQPVFQNIPAAQLDNSINSGRIAMITHWARAQFDDLRFQEFAPPR
jgi:hypothetical protein